MRERAQAGLISRAVKKRGLTEIGARRPRGLQILRRIRPEHDVVWVVEEPAPRELLPTDVADGRIEVEPARSAEKVVGGVLRVGLQILDAGEPRADVRLVQRRLGDRDRDAFHAVKAWRYFDGRKSKQIRLEEIALTLEHILLPVEIARLQRDRIEDR